MLTEAAHLVALALSGAYTILAFYAVLPRWPLPLILGLGLWCYRQQYWLRNDRIHNTLPAKSYPHTDVLLGMDWFFTMLHALKTHAVLEMWNEMFTSIGQTFWNQSIGQWVLLTNEPENVKAMLSTNFEDWELGSSRKKLTQMAIGEENLFALNGDEWKRARHDVKGIFRRGEIRDLQGVEGHVENLLTRVAMEGDKVDMQKLMYLFGMDASTEFMFGYSTDTLLHSTASTDEFARSLDYSLEAAAFRARLGSIAFLKPDPQFDEAVKTTRAFADDFINRAMLNRHSHYEVEKDQMFLQDLLENGKSRSYARDQMLSMIIAGRDTTASVGSSLLWKLARRPDVVSKIRAEMMALQGRKPSWEDLKGLRYLNMVIKEALRLWPPLTTNMRTAVRDTVLPRGGGPDGLAPLFIPKDTPVRWSSYSLHRRKDVYGEDADEFRPERWEGSLRPLWSYVPFSGGPRFCPGQQLALTQLSYLLVRLFQTFESIEPCDALPMRLKIGTGSSLVDGCWIVVERLSKTINEDHLYEIFGTYGRITDLDLPINRSSNTNRGTAYILFERVEDAESAVAHLHEAQVDGATINVSICPLEVGVAVALQDVVELLVGALPLVVVASAVVETLIDQARIRLPGQALSVEGTGIEVSPEAL
ncbi:cytochrome P450 [Emericellopsis atlantica]|uniref:Cytochrome P450 n=1 Tax=Emericellopsis atlantica TaxID=2614577 RepID=A0A9P7ZVE9_9HYPO|nr:cytochrome P450 [Emericellopsis atlantica]KAG9258546.1 cytochrome P450 [Emericellopsis atlantica]